MPAADNGSLPRPRRDGPGGMTILRNSTGRRSVLAAAAVLLAVTACLARCGTVPDRSAAASRTSARITAADRRTRTGPAVVVKPDGCLSDLVSVGGVRQPPLQDGEAVTNAASRLLKAGS